MSYSSENNILFSFRDDPKDINNYIQHHLSLFKRIMIDIGIAAAALISGAVTGGIAPSLVGTVSGAVGVIGGASINTGIDLGEGNTDALTIGLDLGLPFATEGVGKIASSLIKQIKFGVNTLSKLTKINIPKHWGIDEYIYKGGKLFGKNTKLNIKGWGTKFAEHSKNALNPNIGITPKNIISHIQSIEKAISKLGLVMNSITDIFDKVTGVLKDYLRNLLPRLAKMYATLKKLAAKLLKTVMAVFNPFAFAENLIRKRLFKVLNKNKELTDIFAKIHMREKFSKEIVEKRSILSNAIISKYNLEPVASKWVLGTTTVIKKEDEMGNATIVDLVWFFVPETTKHNGERGAVPEPLGKRPIIMKNIPFELSKTIKEEASKGSYYWYNVMLGKANTELFKGFGSKGRKIGNAIIGGATGKSDLGQNLDLRKIQMETIPGEKFGSYFNNILSIVPGYSLFNSVKLSVKGVQHIANDIIKGTYGTRVMRGLNNYYSYLKQYGTHHLPHLAQKKLNNIYGSQKVKYDTTKLFIRANGILAQSNRGLNKRIKRVTHVNHIKHITKQG